ncbi:MAG: ECF transporter S component [Treponema sp.]|jgi:uncharacterized membrane protein|nr:ECF transporter S component [Treponema sp.]
MVSMGVRKVAVTGVLSAVVIVLGITRLGFITLPLGSIIIMHVPVILGAVLEGPVVGLVTGFLFGLFSLIQAAISAASPLDAAFVNPLFSIVPRLFIGPGAWLIYALASGNFGGSEKHSGVVRETAGIAAAAVGGTLINTALVLSLLGAFKVLPWEIIALAAVTNAPVEAGTAAVITLAVALSWKRIRPGRSRLSRERNPA